MPGEGGEDTEWAHLAPERADGCLSHALLEAATRGQALTSYQGHRNHRISGYPGAAGSELRLATSSPGRVEKWGRQWSRAWSSDLDLGSNSGSTT